MALKLSNNADGLLALAISDSDTSLTLEAGHGSRFPELGSGDWFPITVVRASDPSKLEIMRCTARSGDTLTVVRAQEGTAAITFSAGDVVELRLTSGTLEENFPQVEGANAKNLRFIIDSVGGKPRLKFKSGDDEETVVRQSDFSNLDPGTQIVWNTPAGDRLGIIPGTSAGVSHILFGDSGGAFVRVYGPSGATYPGEILLTAGGNTQLRITSNGIALGASGVQTFGYGTLNAVNGLYDGGVRVLPIGVGQTWQDVKAQRAWGTTYTNTTGRPIAVHIYATNFSGKVVIMLTIDGVTFTSPAVENHNDGVLRSTSIFAIIPPGAGYKANCDYTLTHWNELR